MMDVYFYRIKLIFFSWMAFRYQFDIIDNGRQGGVQRQERGFNRFFLRYVVRVNKCNSLGG